MSIRSTVTTSLRRLADRIQGDPTCPGGCGQPLSESTDPANEGRYRAPLPTRCHACTALANARRRYTAEQGAQYPECLTFSVELHNPVATPIDTLHREWKRYGGVA